MNPEVWAIVAVAAYWLFFLAVFEAFKPKPDWHWGGDDYPKDIYWVRSLGPNDLQGSEPKSAADSPSE